MNKTVSIKMEHCTLGFVITTDHTTWTMKHYEMLLFRRLLMCIHLGLSSELFFSQGQSNDCLRPIYEAQILKFLLLQNSHRFETCKLDAVHGLLAYCQGSVLKFVMFC